MSSSLDSLQNRELAEEIEAINAIFDPTTIDSVTTSPDDSHAGDAPHTLNSNPNGNASLPITATITTATIQIPNHPHLSFIVGFDGQYPEIPPHVIGTASTASRGEGKIAIDVLEDIIQRSHQPGQVCLFEVLSEASEKFEELNIGGGDKSKFKGDDYSNIINAQDDNYNIARKTTHPLEDSFATLSLRDAFGIDSPPDWKLSDVVTEKKSVFVGRVAPVSSRAQAEAYLDHLLATDKKVAAATHNISAWRLREEKTNSSAGETIVQDCDDDGETAAGGRLLHLMQLMDVWDVVVVVTRWYGGVKLGPDRFRIINNVGRDALVKGGFAKDAIGGGGEKGKKKGRK